MIDERNDILDARRRTIEDFFVDCCRNSAIYYEHKYVCIKYLVGEGKVVYIEKSRMLDLVEAQLPAYEKGRDEEIVSDIFRSSDRLIFCESHDYNGCHYVYSIMLRDSQQDS